MADIVDFTFVLANGEILRKSGLPSEQWEQFCPVGRVRVDGGDWLPMFSQDVLDVWVDWRGQKIKIRTKPHWGAFRFFCHHNGISFLDQGPGRQTGTTFGVVYLDQKVVHRFLFTADGNMVPSTEVFTHVESVV